MSITVIIPRNSSVRKYVRDRYNELWNAWKRANPTSRDYTVTKLNTNIRNVLSVSGKQFNNNSFRMAIYTPWIGRKVLPYAHWFFLVDFQQNRNSQIYAIVEDACYEGDYHNDTMNTTPYDESILKDKKPILEKYVLNGNRKGKTKYTNTR